MSRHILGRAIQRFLDRLEAEIATLRAIVIEDEMLPKRQRRKARWCLETVEEHTISDDEDLLSHEKIEGRGQGDGRWLEYQLRRALERWGYRADIRQTAYGLEVDVVVRHKGKTELTDRLDHRRVQRLEKSTSDGRRPREFVR